MRIPAYLFAMWQAPETEDKGEDEQAEQAEREMHRTLSGRYKNPAIDNMQPFGIESRPSQPLSTLDRQATLVATVQTPFSGL